MLTFADLTTNKTVSKKELNEIFQRDNNELRNQIKVGKWIVKDLVFVYVQNYKSPVHLLGTTWELIRSKLSKQLQTEITNVKHVKKYVWNNNWETANFEKVSDIPVKKILNIHHLEKFSIKFLEAIEPIQ